MNNAKLVYINRLSISGPAINELHQIIVFNGDGIRHRSEGAISKHRQLTATDVDLNLSSGIQTGKDNIVRIFQHDMGEEQLTSCETVTAGCTQDLDAHTTVSICVVEGAAHSRAVRIVVGLILRIIDQKTYFVTVKSTVDKDVVATVVDTPVQTPHAQNIGKGMILTEMRDVDACTAVPDMAIGHGHGGGDAVAGIGAGYSAAGETVNKASADHGMLRLILPILGGCCSQKRNAVASANFLRQDNFFCRTDNCQIFHSTPGGQPDCISFLHILLKENLCAVTDTDEGRTLRHTDSRDRISSASKKASTVPRQLFFDCGCHVRSVIAAG